jgi:predicted nucleic acid-binding protein
MRTVFVDTVAFLARWNVRDQWHGSAKPVFDELIDNNVRLLTTTFVFLECGNALARSPMRTIVADVMGEYQARGLLVTPTEEEWQRAWWAYRRGESGEASIVDHISFQVMRRLGIVEAFTNDRHFAAAGFQVLF